MSKIITAQMNPFEIPDNHLHHGYSVSNNSISKKLKDLLIHPYYYCFPGEVACLMISDCLQKDPTIAFEALDLTGRKLLNYVAMWCNDTDGCVALIQKIKKMGGDINGSPFDLGTSTPLKLAMKHVHIKKIKVLLELGANVRDYDDLINTLDHSSVANSLGDRVFAVNKARQEKYKNAQKELKSTELSHERLQKKRVILENKIADAQEKIAKQTIKVSELEEKIMEKKESFDEYKKLAQGAFVNKKSAIMALLEEHKNKKSEDEIKKIGGQDIDV